MNKTITIAVLMLFSSQAYATDRDLNSAEFGALELTRITAESMELPAPPADTASRTTGAKCGHVSGEITQLHFYAQTAKNRLFTYAETESLFNEFVAMWTPILQKFGLRPAGTEYKNTFGTLKYESPDGRVVRDFLAEKMTYNALDPAEMAKLQHELLEPLEKAGMTPIASFNIRNDIFRPTFNIYYLTTPNENPDHEIRLRQLKSGGDDIDFDILDGAVQIVKKDRPFSLVYIGKELGFKTKWSATEEGINAKLADYRKYLTENNKEFIGSKIIKLDEPWTSGDITINYIAHMYFFQ